MSHASTVLFCTRYFLPVSSIWCVVHISGTWYVAAAAATAVPNAMPSYPWQRQRRRQPSPQTRSPLSRNTFLIRDFPPVISYYFISSFSSNISYFSSCCPIEYLMPRDPVCGGGGSGDSHRLRHTLHFPGVDRNPPPHGWPARNRL